MFAKTSNKFDDALIAASIASKIFANCVGYLWLHLTWTLKEKCLPS